MIKGWKRTLAIILNVALIPIALLTVASSASFMWHRPEVPEELKGSK